MPTKLFFLAVSLFTLTSPARAEESTALFTRLDANKDGQLAADEISAEHQRLFKRLLRIGDKNDDGQLTEKEFAAALTPSRPEKPIEKEQDSENPGAKATKWLLLALDTNGDSRLEVNEIPEDYLRVFDRLVEQIDRDEDSVLTRNEINRGGPAITRQAVQTVQRMGINVDRELAKLVKQQGDRANRFDSPPNLQESFSNPAKGRDFFASLDANGDKFLEIDELPEPLRERLERPFRRADSNRDGKLSSEEFAVLARRIGAIAELQYRPNRPNSDRPRRKPESKPGS